MENTKNFDELDYTHDEILRANETTELCKRLAGLDFDEDEDREVARCLLLKADQTAQRLIDNIEIYEDENSDDDIIEELTNWVIHYNMLGDLVEDFFVAANYDAAPIEDQLDEDDMPLCEDEDVEPEIKYITLYDKDGKEYQVQKMLKK